MKQVIGNLLYETVKAFAQALASMSATVIVMGLVGMLTSTDENPES